MRSGSANPTALYTRAGPEPYRLGPPLPGRLSNLSRLTGFIRRRHCRWRSLAAFPAGGKERQEVRDLIWMFLCLRPIDVDTQARRGGNLNPAVDHLYRRRHDLSLPVDVELIEEFLHEEIRRAGSNLHTDGRRDRPLCLMRSDNGVVRIRHGADHSRTEDAAHDGRIRLQNMDRVVFEQLGELMGGVKALAGRHRHGQPAPDFRGGVDLGVVSWFLEPGGVVLGDSFADPDRLGDAKAPVPFDHDLNVRPDSLAHGRDDVDREFTVLRVHRPPG